MQFTLLQHWENINHNHGIQVTIEDKLWHKWYKEMMRRYRAIYRAISILNYNEIRTYDVDECQECGVIGIEHLTECLAFLANNK